MNRVPTDIDCPKCNRRTQTPAPGLGNKLRRISYILSWSLLGLQLASVRWHCLHCGHQFKSHSFHTSQRFD